MNSANQIITAICEYLQKKMNIEQDEGDPDLRFNNLRNLLSLNYLGNNIVTLIECLTRSWELKMSDYPKEWEKRVFLRNGKQAFLRPELSSDTEMLWEMFSTLSEDSLSNLMLPVTKERVKGWTSNIDYDKNLSILALVKEEKERIVGCSSLSFNQAEALKHKAELGITVHDNYQNLGLGTAMTKHLLEIAGKKGLKKVFLRVNTDNIRAIHVYEKCGFQIEAKLRKEYYGRGKYRDDYRMAIFL